MSQLTKPYSLAVAEDTHVRYGFRCYRSDSAFDLTKGDRGLHWPGSESMDVIGAAPLTLAVLIALGGILVTMSYLSE
jgi:hypothetical protein